MTKIHKAKETMSAKERVLRTFAFEKTDRVPIDYATNGSIHHRLCVELGIPGDNYDLLLEALGVDYRSVAPAYTGPLLYPPLPGRQVDPLYGFYTRWVENESGGYHDFCDFPLQGADEETIRTFPFPSPDDFDYDAALEQIKRQKDYAVYVGNPGTGDIINSLGRVMGMEDTLVNLMTEDEATLDLAQRKLDMELGVMERLLDRAKGGVDFLWMGEDLGTQIAPMISLSMYRSVLRPMHQRFIDLAKTYDLPVMVHTCGSSSWVYEDFIEMGVDAVDTLQPEAVHMSPAYLKEQFGGRLSFHGCISTAGPLAYGTPADVARNVTETLEILMPGGGYHLAPTHQLQDNSPVENVIAMYQTAHERGVY